MGQPIITKNDIVENFIEVDSVDILTNKSIDADTNSITNIGFDEFDTDTSDLMGFANAIALDSPVVTVTSNGTTIALNLERSGGGDIRFIFSDGVHVHDTTPVEQVVLTEGSDTIPQINYIYILQSTKMLTNSTSGFPATEHAPIATVLCQSASSLQTDGAYKVHAWTDHATSSNNMGHLAHINSWIRARPAGYVSGVVTTLTTGIGIFTVATSSGVIKQLHDHTFPARTTPTDPVFIVNDSVTAYSRITDPTTILTDALGSSMSNARFNVVIWGSVNEASSDCKIFWNLPTGSYNSDQNAIDDIDKTSVYSIPNDYIGTGFLIARLTVRHISSSNTWSILQNESLLGKVPSTDPSGTVSGATTEYSDAVFKIFNNLDNTKEILFDASNITTANSRTIIMADADVDLANVNSEPLTLMFSGQSNMNGIIENNTTGGDKTTNEKVTVWDDISQAFIVADLDLYPFGERSASPAGLSTGNNNLAFHTAKRVQEKTGKNVQILFASFSGQTISNWVGAGTSSANWVALQTIADDSGVTNIDAFFWHQGEADSSTAVLLASTYSADLETLISQFRAMTVVNDTNRPFICGELAPQYRLNDVFYSDFENLKYIQDNNVAIAKAKDLTLLADLVHFTGQSLVDLSYRYSDMFFSTPNNKKYIENNYLSITTTGINIDSNIRFVDVDISSANLVVVLPLQGTFDVLDINIGSGGSGNFARIQVQGGDTLIGGDTSTRIDLYGTNSSIRLISDTNGISIVNIDTEVVDNTFEILGGTSVVSETFTELSKNHVICRGVDVANINIILPQHDKQHEFYIEREIGCTNPVNILETTGAEIDNGTSNLTIPEGALYRFYYSEDVSLYKWQIINYDISLKNIVEDITPQLGGELDTNGHSIGGDSQTATGDGATTIDWGLGNTFNFQFGAFDETFTFTAPTKAGTFILKLVQDSIGSRTVTFPANVKWIGGSPSALTTTPTTGTDIITFYYDGTDYFAVESLNFS